MPEQKEIIGNIKKSLIHDWIVSKFYQEEMKHCTSHE